MKKRILYALLFAAIASCEKESPTPSPSDSMVVPLPWKKWADVQTTSSAGSVKAEDCLGKQPPSVESPSRKAGCSGGGSEESGKSSPWCRKDTVICPPPPPPPSDSGACCR
ncbi:MAG TPA: hypothetical protein VKR32_15830 [Puia sp.]|nr:hypothetical protein [Puia sp.]